jgi:hypothetical protein
MAMSSSSSNARGFAPPPVFIKPVRASARFERARGETPNSSSSSTMLKRMYPDVDDARPLR